MTNFWRTAELLASLSHIGGVSICVCKCYFARVNSVYNFPWLCTVVRTLQAVMMHYCSTTITVTDDHMQCTKSVCMQATAA